MIFTPPELKYTKEHEWGRTEGEEVVVGITQYAAQQLGDVVFVELPKPGTMLTAQSPFGVVESVKSVSDLFAPVSGVVTAINEELTAAPERVNEDPYGVGWMIRLRPADPRQMEQLLSAAAYQELLAQSGH
ncbi:MAG: glycine cleavage system protein GcvH [Magnetococcales bacterium]|nr:glycine cleavage system protein GcvH [Magnetococcales bacterium]